MPIRMRPPKISARLPTIDPTLLPISCAIIVIINAAKPTVIAAIRISVFRKAKLRPTARESILVAIDKANRVSQLLMFFFAFSSSSSRKDSQSIRPPMKASNPKASQWSYAEIKSMTVRPANHPITIIKAWKIPKASGKRKNRGNERRRAAML